MSDIKTLKWCAEFGFVSLNNREREALQSLCRREIERMEGEAVNSARSDYDEKCQSLMRAFTDAPSPDALSAAHDEALDDVIEKVGYHFACVAGASEQTLRILIAQVPAALKSLRKGPSND